MRQFFLNLLYRILKWGYDKYLLEIYEGIRICDLASSNALKSEQYRNRIIQALELIKQNDHRRFRQIQKRLVYIVNGPCSGAGEYKHPLRACYIDIARFDFISDEDWYVLQVACTLIHEATHGKIASKSIITNKLNALRIERICHQEEMRFVNRVMPEADIEEFDPTWWEENLKLNTVQRAARVVERLQELAHRNSRHSNPN